MMKNEQKQDISKFRIYKKSRKAFTDLFFCRGGQTCRRHSDKLVGVVVHAGVNQFDCRILQLLANSKCFNTAVLMIRYCFLGRFGFTIIFFDFLHIVFCSLPAFALECCIGLIFSADTFLGHIFEIVLQCFTYCAGLFLFGCVEGLEKTDVAGLLDRLTAIQKLEIA